MEVIEMTQLEIQLLLEELYQENFLDRILLTKQKEKDYNSSEFFKLTKIKLPDLFKEYESYYNYSFDSGRRILEILKTLDWSFLSERISQVLEGVLDSEKIKALLESVVESFDLSEIKQQNEELSEQIQSLKK
jgi:hypothetical protein